MSERCGNCRWFERHHAGAGSGLCVLTPPVPIQRFEDGLPFWDWEQPEVRDTARCSHHVKE